MSVLIEQNSLKAAFKTDSGLKRQNNEDAILADCSRGVFAIADGMGGHKAGHVASKMAIKTLTDSLGTTMNKKIDPIKLMNQVFWDAHNTILSASRNNSQYEDMGTTLVVALRVGDSSFIIGHVGDSRAYHICNDKIEPLTKDHSFLSEWIEQGIVSYEDARSHPARHGLYMALGIDDEFEPRIGKVRLAEKDLLLLCSDGLTDMVAEKTILEKVRRANSIQSACDDLIAEANTNGGDDNCSALLIQIDNQQKSFK
ncbi:MAG: Stp1/IreP family PP2C-type Ser/Thr phosphatase [Syntrophaceae bacterium]|nr:Stp1/IreP family PP2C-type Ser/Thr phosphatase [Syntrophaceae bacterium]